MKKIRSSFSLFQNVDGTITGNGMDNNEYFLHLSYLLICKTNFSSNKDNPKCVTVISCFVSFHDEDDQIL